MAKKNEVDPVRRGWLARAMSFGTLRESEYRASINALNIFFGAIVGVNFSNMEDLPPADYAIVLFITSALIALILIVSNSSRRLWSIVQLLIAMGGYYYLARVDVLLEGVTDHLLITLGVWAGGALLYEISGRVPDPDHDTP